MSADAARPATFASTVAPVGFTIGVLAGDARLSGRPDLGHTLCDRITSTNTCFAAGGPG